MSVAVETRLALLERARSDPRFARVVASLDRDHELGIRNPVGFDNYKDLAYALTASAGAGPTTTLTVTLATGYGQYFPTGNFVVCLGNPTFNRSQIAGSEEVTYCDSRSVDVLTLHARAMYGPNGAFALNAGGGDYAFHGLTTKGLTDIQAGITGKAAYAATPADPAAVTSGSLVMAGLGSAFKLTPAVTGNVLFGIHGRITAGAGSVNAYSAGYYGTGTAPANATSPGSAGTTRTKATQTPGVLIPSAGSLETLGITAAAIGLTLGTSYWFDLAIASDSSTCTASQLNVYAIEV